MPASPLVSRSAPFADSVIEDGARGSHRLRHREPANTLPATSVRRMSQNKSLTRIVQPCESAIAAAWAFRPIVSPGPVPHDLRRRRSFRCSRLAAALVKHPRLRRTSPSVRLARARPRPSIGNGISLLVGVALERDHWSACLPAHVPSGEDALETDHRACIASGSCLGCAEDAGPNAQPYSAWALVVRFVWVGSGIFHPRLGSALARGCGGFALTDTASTYPGSNAVSTSPTRLRSRPAQPAMRTARAAFAGRIRRIVSRSDSARAERRGPW